MPGLLRFALALLRFVPGLLRFALALLRFVPTLLLLAPGPLRFVPGLLRFVPALLLLAPGLIGFAPGALRSQWRIQVLLFDRVPEPKFLPIKFQSQAQHLTVDRDLRSSDWNLRQLRILEAVQAPPLQARIQQSTGRIVLPVFWHPDPPVDVRLFIHIYIYCPLRGNLQHPVWRMISLLPDLVRSAVSRWATECHHHVWCDSGSVVPLAVVHKQVGRYEHIVALPKEVQQRVVGRTHVERLIGVVGHGKSVVAGVIDFLNERCRNCRCALAPCGNHGKLWTGARRRSWRCRFYRRWLRSSLADLLERHGNLAESTGISPTVYSHDPCVARDSLFQRTSVRRPLGVLGLR